ncbi:MAG TPA: PIN domain-containing protein [Pseudomonadales bacterium]|jgi:predicted nucleic acid-binding protein|nr:PIN domain-containing protein [Pseudomonadales bacterium]HNG03441.1 PIN domain-containing protein [Nitrospira sp.]HNG78354.1 PIN domain-containing protein [Burkholderiaceae bacterium]HMW14279.1 PIN domain-containing protein [Pseudomonadales bacterium]HMW82716.1 PIN domain-containing protein [Pseudomonadales bacterium]
MATTDGDGLFVDTNVLVYANVAEAPFHQAALDAISQASDRGCRLWISRQVIREYLVVMTRPQTFASLSRELVLDQVRAFGGHFNIADDSADVTHHLLALLAVHPVGGKRIHDANIVATMLAWNIPKLLTQNVEDFACFNEIVHVDSLE